MTPEVLALLAEIARLRHLVVSGHVHNFGLNFGDILHGGCSCGFPIETRGQRAKARHVEIHAAHVAAILNDCGLAK